MIRHEENFQSIAHKFLHLANRGIPKFDFFQQILHDLLGFSGCHSMELWVHDGGMFTHFVLGKNAAYNFELMQAKKDAKHYVPVQPKSTKLEGLRRQLLTDRFKQRSEFLTRSGNLYSGDIHQEYGIRGVYRSLVLIQIFFGDEKIGLLQMMSKKRNHFSWEEIHRYEDLAHNLGVAIINQRTQAALRERVKELSCLYNISRITEKSDAEFDTIMQLIVEEIKPAWQYPEITEGCIQLDGKAYKTKKYTENSQKQTADIIVKGSRRGNINVVYLESKPPLSEGPFLEEERNLIDTLAKQIALLIERREAERDRLDLQGQLRHADRLATIGQLSAGVAHELNEPLGNILGFAQLTKKSHEMPKQAHEDIDKIVDASLHAREIIKKLMLFARQLPSQSSMVNLNQVVEEGMYFFEARCKKAGIEVVRQLAPDLVHISGDQTQLNQVLVNLVVNAIQAMPHGGKLRIKTINGVDYISLIVEDTGIGMSDDVQNKIFIPFFTTKDVNEGTGLGLSVVHGIVSSHKGIIKVESEVNKGSKFTIQFMV